MCIRDRAETAEWARQLRSLLEHSSDPSDSKYWKDLWAAEFRTTALSQFDALRKRVAVDVQRLETRPEPRKQALLEALLDGYNLTRQTQSAKWIEQRLDPDEGVPVSYTHLDVYKRQLWCLPRRHRCFRG